MLNFRTKANKKNIVIFFLAALLASCSTPELQSVLMSESRDPFIGLAKADLPENDRTILSKASEDFKAVVAGKAPVHARFDESAPLPADGGTEFFVGDGYLLTVVKSISTFGSFHGIAYGPVINFERNFAPGNTSTISNIRVYSIEELKKLLDQKKIDF